MRFFIWIFIDLCSLSDIEAQLPVNKEPENRHSVYEEFTRRWCFACPTKHEVADWTSYKKVDKLVKRPF